MRTSYLFHFIISVSLKLRLNIFRKLVIVIKSSKDGLKKKSFHQCRPCYIFFKAISKMSIFFTFCRHLLIIFKKKLFWSSLTLAHQSFKHLTEVIVTWNLGGGIAQRKCLRFLPSCPGFKSWLCWDFPSHYCLVCRECWDIEPIWCLSKEFLLSH